MADSKVSELTAATSAAAADQVNLVQSGASNSLTTAALFGAIDTPTAFQDKISILEIKKEKISNPDSLKFINNEYDILKDQFNKNVKVDDKLNKLFKSLNEINGKLWFIEND